jgi:hypothetical protein
MPCTLTKIDVKAVPGNPPGGTRFYARPTDRGAARQPHALRPRPISTSLLPTFGYRLTPKGRGILFVGKPRRTVGYRPPLKVAPAREQAQAMLVDIRQGRDPVVERKARAARVAAGTMTVVQLAEKWLANYVRPKLKPRTVEDYQRLLAQHILPPMGSLPVASVERSDAERLHVAMARTPRRANYTISTGHVLFQLRD